MAATATASSVGPRYAPHDPTLPKPWRGLVDGKTGYLYFWNPETNVTQYERPANSAALPRSSVPSSSVQVQQSSQGPRRDRSPDLNDRYGRSIVGGPNAEAGYRNHQNPKGGCLGSHNVPNGMHMTGNVSSSIRSHGLSDAEVGLTPESYRRRHEITVSGDNVPPPFTSFGSTGFPSEILREVHNAGFSAPTPIQAQSWPIALQSRDIVAIAKTGSGKTLGYLIPGFIHLKRVGNDSKLGPTVLVLSPTRELATQIQDEAVKFAKSSRISCACLYGGAPKGPQLRDIDRGADIVVATPGRLNDILEMRRISLHQVSYLVLDEADRMLDMGFEPQIRKIVKEVPARRQTLMFTATWPKEVRKIAADLLVNPVQVNIGNVDELVANKSITQHIEVLAPLEKHRRLEQILRSQDPGSKIIVFCSTKKMCDQLARNLTRQFGAAAIHGDKSQAERDHVLNQFRTGRSPVLVATDVAARGLDIKDIRVVVNYDFPTGVEDYVHRIGRTGRAGATGLAYTFFGDQDAKHALDLIKILEGANQRVPSELRDLASRGGGMNRSRRWGSGGRGGRSDSGYGGRGSDSGYGGRGSDSGYGGRGGWGATPGGRGRGSDYDLQRNDAHEKYGKGRSHSRSPDRSRNFCRDRSRSRSPNRHERAAPPSQGFSFHQAMMERRGGSDHDRSFDQDRNRSRSPVRHDRAPSGRERSPAYSFHQMMMMERGQQSASSRQQQRDVSKDDRSSRYTCSSHWNSSSSSPRGGVSDRSPRQEWGRSPRNKVDDGRYGEEEEGMIPDEGMMPQDDHAAYGVAD
ncbi:DEAD-box ATP-dependent RNA helicase 46 isoform X2 [Neltuma alba]|uniref:DEAD-box ATP-dependent RNA helicase 46 isoform X2 n=1 Tax=Neltuma alba TaxID=207710 RepID=UPI0010A4FA37|nr:DEAD-box ATP-dependent RNA helicase 46-like isoform X2 [Prosopis alba]